MKEHNIKFIEDNIVNFEKIKLGFTRGFTHEDLRQYERIYHEELDPHYVLTYWCSGCVFEMLQRLMYHYEKYKEQKPIQQEEKKIVPYKPMPRKTK